MLITLAFLLAFLSGAFNAVQDTIAHHWERSRFDRWPSRIREFMRSDWRKRYKREPYIKSNRKKWPPTGIADGWHISKTAEITTWLILALLLDPSGFTWYQLVAGFFLLGIVRNIGFNLFYDRILLLK